MRKTPPPQKKEKKKKEKKVTPDISAADLEMLEDAYTEKIITDEELLNMLSI